MSYEPSAAALAGRSVLGRNLRYWRSQRGLTQEVLAQLASLDRSFLVDLETSRHSCTVDRLFDIATALGVEASDLIRNP